jgi:AcrR family transcriptional regulator
MVMNRAITTKGPRERILDVALDLFYSKGFLTTGINEIIQKAEVAKASFYKHFPSKESLCEAYLLERHEIWNAWLEDEIKKHSQPYKRVFAAFDMLEGWMKDCDYRGCAFLNMATEISQNDHLLRKIVKMHKSQLKDRFHELLKELKKSDKQYSDIKANRLSELMFVLFEGAIVTSQSFNEIWPVQVARKEFKKELKKA